MIDCGTAYANSVRLCSVQTLGRTLGHRPIFCDICDCLLLHTLKSVEIFYLQLRVKITLVHQWRSALHKFKIARTLTRMVYNAINR